MGADGWPGRRRAPAIARWTQATLRRACECGHADGTHEWATACAGIKVADVRARALHVANLRSRSIQALAKRTKVVREIIREVAGFAPYERRTLELLKVGKDKRARKFAKRRLGTMLRAKRKIEELTNVLMAQRRAAA